jgi:hypothetical protein
MCLFYHHTTNYQVKFQEVEPVQPCQIRVPFLPSSSSLFWAVVRSQLFASECCSFLYFLEMQIRPHLDTAFIPVGWFGARLRSSLKPS